MADKKIVFLDIDGTFTVPLEKPTELASRACLLYTSPSPRD